MTSRPGLAAPLDLACPSATLCVGIDFDDVETSTDPRAGAVSWSSGTLPAPSTPRGFPVTIACPSANLCVIPNGDGSVTTSTDPAAGAASYAVSASLDPAGFGVFADTHMACPTTSNCLVPDATPGLATIALGPPPSATVDADVGGTTAITGLDCPAARLCLGVDDGAVSTHPARAHSWRIAKIARSRRFRPPAISLISCPSTTFCLAGDADGSIHWSTRPSRGASAWHAVKISGGRLIAASCRSRHFCVVSNARRDVYASTDPTGRRAAWHDVALPTGHFPIASAALENLRSLSCAPHKVCVAASGAGVAFAGRTAK